MFLEMLSLMFQDYSSLEVVATATCVSDAQLVCETLPLDLLVLDLFLPDGNGISVADVFLQYSPDGKIIILSGQASSFQVPDQLLPHILGVVDKTSAYQNIQVLLDGLSDNPVYALTPRQFEIYKLIGAGMQNKEIAKYLNLAIPTVETHRKLIVRELGVSGAELIRNAALFNRSHANHF